MGVLVRVRINRSRIRVVVSSWSPGGREGRRKACGNWERLGARLDTVKETAVAGFFSFLVKYSVSGSGGSSTAPGNGRLERFSMCATSSFEAHWIQFVWSWLHYFYSEIRASTRLVLYALIFYITMTRK
ncbi:hypothetical protein BDA96_02G282800 [Sorghum bicolor]|uniref:Uncharacterized protein n=1 Tax=Sorghum bicolor TaxID=4558 RepID=A0A921UV46_SORBI|nr:hypothetical protein BDA96_02G282800 [Sorghum bicolor]